MQSVQPIGSRFDVAHDMHTPHGNRPLSSSRSARPHQIVVNLPMIYSSRYDQTERAVPISASLRRGRLKGGEGGCAATMKARSSCKAKCRASCPFFQVLLAFAYNRVVILQLRVTFLCPDLMGLSRGPDKFAFCWANTSVRVAFASSSFSFSQCRSWFTAHRLWISAWAGAGA